MRGICGGAGILNGSKLRAHAHKTKGAIWAQVELFQAIHVLVLKYFVLPVITKSWYLTVSNYWGICRIQSHITQLLLPLLLLLMMIVR